MYECLFLLLPNSNRKGESESEGSPYQNDRKQGPQADQHGSFRLFI